MSDSAAAGQPKNGDIRQDAGHARPGEFLSYGADSLRMAIRAFEAGGAPKLARRALALLSAVDIQARERRARPSGMALQVDAEPRAQRLALARRIEARLGDIRHGPAALLARLLDDPDRLIPIDVLMDAVGTGSSSSVIIKVYVCQLRSALRQAGFDDAIMNSRRQGYGLRGDVAAHLRELLQ